jgi:hypothetical protein
MGRARHARHLAAKSIIGALIVTAVSLARSSVSPPGRP